MIKESITKLENIIEKHLPDLHAIPDKDYNLKLSPAKWSKKEILGHLIDSAENNIRRFLVAQYETDPYIVYKQEQWVVMIGYQQWNTKEIIELWRLLNLQICMIWKQMPSEVYARGCKTDTVHSIEWLASDYNKHLLHHLHAILDLEPVAYP